MLNNNTEDCKFDGNLTEETLRDIANFTLLVSSLAILDICVVFGNGLVILAVINSRKLRSVNTVLITSLAVADIMVGIIVLPFSTVNQILVPHEPSIPEQRWFFGEVWCQIWLAVDVWLCTCSIYNLVAISLDRYLAITKPLSYRSIMTMRRGYLAVLSAWAVSFIISFPPMLFSWPEAFSPSRSARCECSPMENSRGYVVYSAFGSFFLPMATVVFVYIRIYQIARNATHSAYTGTLRVGNGSTSASSGQYSQLRVHTRSTKYGSITNSLLSPTNKPSSPNSTVKDPPKCPKERSRPFAKAPSSRQFRSLSSTPQVLRKNRSSGNLKFPGMERCRNRSGSSTRSEHSRNSSCRDLEPLEEVPNTALQIRLAMMEGDSGSKVLVDVSSPDLHSKRHSVSLSSDRKTTLSTQTSYCDSPRERLYEKRNSLTPIIKRRRPSSSPIERRLTVEEEDSNGNPKPPPEAHSDGDKNIKPKTKAKSVQKKEKFKLFRQKRFLDKVWRTRQSRLSLELKAAKTVAVVTGCFIACWLGFSVVYFLQAFPFCSGDSACVPTPVFTVFFWLGYINSALNPVIYAVFNRKFRRAFQELLTCHRFWERRRRMRELKEDLDGRDSSIQIRSNISLGGTEFRNHEVVSVM